MPERAGSPVCIRCHTPLSSDEVGLTKKLINRGSREFQCYSCLAEHFRVSVELLKEKVEQFREMGCLLFEPRQ
ncbi:MAG: hypothetical protein E7318_08265 [Clostridiales bacterium]|nr:hypothetical protein [Clostridiales bacterium]